jgi:hypothetical protein
VLHRLIETSPAPGGVLAGKACLALAAISAQGSDTMQDSLLDWAFSQVNIYINATSTRRSFGDRAVAAQAPRGAVEDGSSRREPTAVR